MRIDRVREVDTKRRKGNSVRTIIQIVWLVLSAAVAYFLSTYIFNNTELTIDFLRTSFLLPATVPDWAIHLGFGVAIMLVLQFVYAIGYAFGSPEGRVKTGKPRFDSRDPDPFDESRPY